MDESEIVKQHSGRFFEYYYEELDRHNIQYEPSSTLNSSTGSGGYLYNSLGDIPEDGQPHSPTMAIPITGHMGRMSPHSDPMAMMRADRVRQASSMGMGGVGPNGYRQVKTDSMRLMKRVYDNYLICKLEIDPSLDLNNLSIMPYVGVIKQQFDFLINIAETDSDYFQLFNVSTLNILFGFITKLKLNILLFENQIEALLSQVSRRSLKLKVAILDNLIYSVHQSYVEIQQIGYLDNWLELGNYTRYYDLKGKEIPRTDKNAELHMIMTPKLVSQRLDTLNYVVKWVYTNYWCQFWMVDDIYIQTQTMVNNFRKWLDEPNVFLMNNTLSIQARIAAYNISPLFIKQFNQLKNVIIGSGGAKWIHRTLDRYRAMIPWTTADFRKSQLVIIDGRNWFYADNGLNVHAIQRYMSPDANQELGNMISTHAKKIGIQFDLAMLYQRNVLVVFNEKHIDTIRRYNPQMSDQCIYTPRGVNDDLFILYMWLSNPGSFIISRDNYTDHATRLTGNKYMEGLWSQWISLYKIS
jgi:hypothetical protein